MKKLNGWAISFALFAAVCATSCSDDDVSNSIQPKADDVPVAKVQADGFWVVNEDWFGHSNGSVNYFKQNSATSYTPSYRVYGAANPDGELGVTTQFGALWGDNFYLVSKQGNRLVVADAKTMKKKAAITKLGGDGRAFVGVTDTKAYVGHSAGIAVLDIPSLQITKQIDGVSGQIGMMCCVAGRVFAVSQTNGLYVINAQTDELEQTISGTYYTLTCSKDGSVWVAGSTGLTCIDPVTLQQTETMAYPDGASIANSWGAWNAGGLCASTQNNVIYWTTGGSWTQTKVYKYDIDAKTGKMIFEFGKSEYDKQMTFYGAGLRVDPLTDELILTAIQNFEYFYNWIYKLDAEGNEITHLEYFGDNGTSGASGATGERYFWFPSLPVFEDANKPQILLNQVVLKPGEEKEIDLKEKVIDYDNTFASMQLEVSDASNATLKLDGHVLTVTAGASEGISACKLSVVSNGVRVEKNIEIVVQE